MIRQLRLKYSVPAVCGFLKLSTSGFYSRVNRKPSRRAQEETRLEIEIQAAHKRTRGVYGPERLRQDLIEHGVHIGISRIRRIRKKLDIRCKQKKKFKITTNSSHKLPVADNLLNQNFSASAPNQVWVSDITYIWTEEGWLYLAGHKDICSKEIVGYAMNDRMGKELVTQSLFKAVSRKNPGEGLIHHSDRGSQYCAYDTYRLLDQFGMKASMSGKGNCYDNAPMESFWGIIKSEHIYHRHYMTREEAIRDIIEYIEVFYNRQRKQAALGYLSPTAYERQFYENRIAA